MSRDDIAADQDATFLVPRPGGKGAAPGASAASGEIPAPTPSPVQSPTQADTPTSGLISTSGLNPLLRAANPLLDLIVPLRRMSTHSDLEDLRGCLVDGVRQFENKARAANLSVETLSAARYALCTFLDETVSSTPWGGGGAWSGRSLLILFHNEASGGEKFFMILQRLAQDPRTNLEVLELMYVCLALGMEGRYRLIEGGRAQLDVLRERLLAMIRERRGPLERDLSPHWQGVVDKRNPLMRMLPMWVLAALTGVILMALQLAFSISLNRASDPVFAALHGVKTAVAEPAATPKAAVALEPVKPRLATFLAPEVSQGLVSVVETLGKSTVTLHGDGMFGSGSADVSSSFYPLLDRIGDALKTVQGRVVVAGHTDDQRIVSARFPSNWHLSQARAEAVRQVLAARTGMPGRFAAEGRGDTEPLVPNDSAANRARNRRVDVTVFTSGTP
ncbi:DotU family type VI secretion system protein [Paraburkholderia sp. D1E]|uniref:DotU family type VI secretion system protein n=1 Tax=Paraburkholderia sp. D1E TaxID=3461398 RepID=UPI004045BBB0